MSMLDRKLRRDLLAAKGLLIAIVLLIVIAISITVNCLGLYTNLETARRSFYAHCRMADFTVDLERFPLLELDRLQDIRGISELRPRISFMATVDLDGVDRPVSGQLVSMPREPSPVINNIVLKSGGYFTGLRRPEVILNDNFARARGIRPGRRIHVLLNGRRQPLEVVGTAVSSEFLITQPPGGMMPDAENFGILFVTEEFAEEALDFEGAANQLAGLLASGFRDRPDVVLENLRTMLHRWGEPTVTPLADQPSHLQIAAEIEQQRTVSLAIPAVFLITASLIMNVLMMRMAEQQRTIVGTLKALGYRNSQLFGHYIRFGIVVGLAGGVPGVLLGHLMASASTELYKDFFEFPNLVNRPVVPVMIGCLALSVVFATVGTLNGVRMILRLEPAEAMRPKPPLVARRTVLEKWVGLWKRLGFRWQTALRCVLRHRIRSATGLFAAAMGTAMILWTLHLIDSVDEIIRFTYEQVLVSDAELSLTSERDYGALLEATRLAGVDRAEPVLAVGCTFRNGHHEQQGAIQGILATARLTVPCDAAGRRVPIPETGLLLSRSLAEALHVSVGEKLTVVPTTGERRERPMVVGRITESYFGSPAYARFETLNRMVGEEDSLNRIQLRTQPGAVATHALQRQLKWMPALQTYTSAREQKAALIEVMAPFNAIVSVLVIFAGLIFCGSILVSSMISLAERQQEVATFRVQGYGPATIGGIFLRETLVVNIIGLILGLPLGYVLIGLFGEAVSNDMIRFPFVISRRSWLLAVVLGLAFTVLSHGLVQRAINRLAWKDVLNVKE